MNMWRGRGLRRLFRHARQTVGIRMALSTTERLVWYCGDRTAKLESATCCRFLIAKIFCFPWHVVGPVPARKDARLLTAALAHCALSDRARSAGTSYHAIARHYGWVLGQVFDTHHHPTAIILEGACLPRQ